MEKNNSNSSTNIAKIPGPEERFKITLNEFIIYIVKTMKFLYGQGAIDIDPGLLADQLLSYIARKEIENPGCLLQSFKKKTRGRIWDEVHSENENFFRNDATTIFSDIDEGLVKKFLDFLSPDHSAYKHIQGEIQKQIWTYVKTLIKITIKEIHGSGRPCRYTNSEGKTITCYLALEREEIVKLASEAKKWEIKFDPVPKITEEEFKKLKKEFE